MLSLLSLERASIVPTLCGNDRAVPRNERLLADVLRLCKDNSARTRAIKDTTPGYTLLEERRGYWKKFPRGSALLQMHYILYNIAAVVPLLPTRATDFFKCQIQLRPSNFTFLLKN